VKEGRRLHGGKFDLGDVWSRRSVVLNDSDSIAARKLSPDPNANFVFVIAYQPDSVDENKLLFELARYNFTSYMVRNFDISIEDVEGVSRMQVAGFRNYDEALQYARQLTAAPELSELLTHCRSLVISEHNLTLIGTRYSFRDYDEYYEQTFLPLPISNEELLQMPDYELPSEPEEEGEILEEDAAPVQRQNNSTFDFDEDFF
jgi:hypothetical protein